MIKILMTMIMDSGYDDDGDEEGMMMIMLMIMISNVDAELLK